MPGGRPRSENSKTALTQVRQTPEERAAWEKAAASLGMTVADLVRTAVDHYLTASKKKRKK